MEEYKMRQFTYSNKTEIIFGKDTEKKVGEKIKGIGNKVLIHYGGGSIVKSGLLQCIQNTLEEANIPYVTLGGVQPNPRVSLVREGIKLCRAEKVDFILAVGGGSVIDSAKAIGIGMHTDGDVWDYFVGKQRVSNMIPLGVVLTIPAAGSESSTGSVITNDDGGYKRAVDNRCMRPTFAILNPELTYTLPAYQTACGIVDMFAHVLERYFTNEPEVGFTDHLCEGVMKSIIEEGQKVMATPQDYNVRANIMWAGVIAHNGLLGTGRIEDWASHLIEHEMSGLYDLTHGAGLAIVFPAWMQYVYQQDVDRFVRFAENVFGIVNTGASKDAMALQGIDAMKSFFESLNMPTSFDMAKLPKDQLEKMAEKATENGSIGSFVKLDKEDVQRILEIAASH